jgi:hypothetical protein
VNRPTYVIELEALPTAADPDRRLAMLLKYALRSCGLKCRHAARVEPASETADSTAGQATIAVEES